MATNKKISDVMAERWLWGIWNKIKWQKLTERSSLTKPSESENLAGSVATMWNTKTKTQSNADFKNQTWIDVTKPIEKYVDKDPRNHTKSDEDLDNLITAMAMIMPWDFIESWWARLIWWLIKKLWTKNFKSEAVDAALENILSKSKWFTSKQSRPFRSHKLNELSRSAYDDAANAMQPAYRRRIDVNQFLDYEDPLLKNNPWALQRYKDSIADSIVQDKLDTKRAVRQRADELDATYQPTKKEQIAADKEAFKYLDSSNREMGTTSWDKEAESIGQKYIKDIQSSLWKRFMVDENQWRNVITKQTKAIINKIKKDTANIDPRIQSRVIDYIEDILEYETLY